MFTKILALIAAIRAGDLMTTIRLIGELISMFNTMTPAEHAEFNSALQSADKAFAFKK